MGEEFTGMTACKVTTFRQESLSSMVLKKHIFLFLPWPLPSAATGGQILGRINPLSDKVGCSYLAMRHLRTHGTSGTPRG